MRVLWLSTITGGVLRDLRSRLQGSQYAVHFVGSGRQLLFEYIKNQILNRPYGVLILDSNFESPGAVQMTECVRNIFEDQATKIIILDHADWPDDDIYNALSDLNTEIIDRDDLIDASPEETLSALDAALKPEPSNFEV